MSFSGRGSAAVALLGLLLLLAACGRKPYSSFRPSQNFTGLSALARKPVFQRGLYRCTVDGRFLFKTFHLSGLLLIKAMPDGSTRVVFQNEMGFPFFDFEWNAADSFRVVSVNEKMDRAALIKVLRKDFELVLMKGLDFSSEKAGTIRTGIVPHGDWAEIPWEVHRFSLRRGFADYYLWGANYSEDDSLFYPKTSIFRIENFGARKITGIRMCPTALESCKDAPPPAAVRRSWSYIRDGKKVPDNLPRAVTITHHRAHFTIQLDRLPTPPDAPDDQHQHD